MNQLSMIEMPLGALERAEGILVLVQTAPSTRRRRR
jgi:hypothetical protein